MSTLGQGHRIKALREHRGWTGRELARRVGISNTYVSNIENERANLRAPVQRALAAVFGWADYDQMIRSDAMEPPTHEAAAENAIAVAVRAELARLLGVEPPRPPPAEDGNAKRNTRIQVPAGAAALLAVG